MTLSNYFDLSPRSLAIKEFFSKPKYNHILKPEDCLSEPCTILQLDMRTVQVADLEVRAGRWCVRACGKLVLHINEFLCFLLLISPTVCFLMTILIFFYIFILLYD